MHDALESGIGAHISMFDRASCPYRSLGALKLLHAVRKGQIHCGSGVPLRTFWASVRPVAVKEQIANPWTNISIATYPRSLLFQTHKGSYLFRPAVSAAHGA